MLNLARRLRKLEAAWKDANGLVPHTEQWLKYWRGKIDQVVAGEANVDLRGITIEVVDAILADSQEAA